MASFLKMSHSVYIIYSESLDKFYKGQTNDLSVRIMRHNMKYEKATQNGAPWILIWSTTKLSRSSAIILERKLKNLTRKRLIDFILKYPEDVEGPDEFLLLEKLSGC
jgi:putative endonuclease